MKSLFFDSGPLISLSMNNLLWIIPPLKEKFKGEFYITEAVKRECVERPLNGKRFKFEALQLLRFIQQDTLKVYSEPGLKESALSLLDLGNKLFRAQDSYIKNIQYAEIETIAAARQKNAEAVVIDEFITRTLIENPYLVGDRMEAKLHMKVEAQKENIEKFKDEIKGIKVIRSFELVIVAFEGDLFREFYLNIPEPKKTLLEALLWAIKLNGCSVSEQEINEIISNQNL